MKKTFTLELHSTSPLERLNKEIKRRSNVVGISWFPGSGGRCSSVHGWTAIEFVGWAADGKGVFITGFSGRGPRLTNTAVLYLTVDGRLTVLRHEQNEWHILPRASPDGRSLAFSTMIFESNGWLVESRPQEERR